MSHRLAAFPTSDTTHDAVLEEFRERIAVCASEYDALWIAIELRAAVLAGMLSQVDADGLVTKH